MQTLEQKQILLNVRVHDAIADQYEHLHQEIFNRDEQSRLASAVRRVVSYVGNRGPLAALDVGCGSGNVTRHLLDAGCVVTASDVSRNFLAMCEAKFASSGRLRAVLLSGNGLAELPDAAFDVVSAYSVLHHIPDYPQLVAEMVRVAAPGGVIYIDHESSERVYHADPVYDEFVRLAGKSRSSLKRLLTRTRWRRRIVHFVRSVVRPTFQTEGDIHVWPDDHVEFDLLREILVRRCEILEDHEYLLYPDGLNPAIYNAYVAARCTDMRLLIARKQPGVA